MRRSYWYINPIIYLQSIVIAKVILVYKPYYIFTIDCHCEGHIGIYNRLEIYNRLSLRWSYWYIKLHVSTETSPPTSTSNFACLLCKLLHIMMIFFFLAHLIKLYIIILQQIKFDLFDLRSHLASRRSSMCYLVYHNVQDGQNIAVVNNRRLPYMPH